MPAFLREAIDGKVSKATLLTYIYMLRPFPFLPPFLLPVSVSHHTPSLYLNYTSHSFSQVFNSTYIYRVLTSRESP